MHTTGKSHFIKCQPSYIGLGPPPPSPDWGLMVFEERGYMLKNPWPVFGPSIAISFAVIGFNLFGDGIRNLLLTKGSIN